MTIYTVKKFKTFLVFVFLLTFVARYTNTYSASHVTAGNFSKLLDSHLCADVVGAPVISVNRLGSNLFDYGVANNYWATKDFIQNIKVWRTVSPDRYCARVEFNGVFTANPGQLSPNATTFLTEELRGTFYGGYITMLISNNFNETVKNNGLLEKVDYGCEAFSGTCAYGGNWVSNYFSDYLSIPQWLYYKYSTPNNGTFEVSFEQGAQGDIY